MFLTRERVFFVDRKEYRYRYENKPSRSDDHVIVYLLVASGSRMSVMHDNRAANASSDSGEKNTLEWLPASNRTPLPRFSDSTQAVQAADQQYGGLQHQQTILLVEDDRTLATLEADILTAHGYTVDFVHSGEHAITTLYQAIPNLVVLDLELPGDIHGWDVLQALRTVASIPVLITSSSVSSARKYLRKSGETRQTLDHLSKPYPLQALLKRIERMLSISPTP